MPTASTFARRTAAALLVSTAALLSVQAHAESAVTTPAAAAAGSVESDQLNVIVVTAQRREESSQDVPIAIVSLTGDALAQSGYTDVTDLQYTVPGVQYDPTQGAAFQIRGVGSTSFDFSNAKSVSVVVDGVVMDGQRANGLIGLVDIAKVDVLKGPQGTLFGKNATSGVINVETNLPRLGELAGHASASYGEHNERILNGTLNVPIGQIAALRVSAFDQAVDGFGRNVTLHRQVGATHDYGGRARLLVEPSDRLNFVLSADYAHHWDSSVRTPVADQPAAVAEILKSLGVYPGETNADTADSSFGEIRTEEYGSSLAVNAKLGDHDLKSITAYRHTAYYNSTPANLTPIDRFAYVPVNIGDLKTNKFSQELHLSSPAGGLVEYVVGAFYNKLHAEQSQIQWATLGSPVYTQDGSPNVAHMYALTGASDVSDANASLFTANNETAAVFGQITVNLSPSFKVNLGGRQTWDWNNQRLDFIYVDPDPYLGFTPAFFGTSASPAYPYGKVNGNNFSYRIAPEWHFSENAMIYGSYSTGYKPGGVAFVGNKYNPYRKETVKSWELGIKSEWFDRRLRVNLDVFRSDFTDFQTTILTEIPDGAGGTLQTTAIGNAGGLRSQGVEGTIAVVPTRGLTLGANFAYTDAWFTDYVYDETTNYTGTRLTNSPDWMTSITADYEHQFAGGLAARAHVEYNYRSESWTVVGQPDYSHVPGYGLTNARLTFSLPSNGVEFGLYARNLFDVHFSTGYQIYGALGLLHYTSPAARRTAGAFVNFDF